MEPLRTKAFSVFKGRKYPKSARRFDSVCMFVSGNADAASNLRLQKLSQTAERRLNAQISRSSKRKLVKKQISLHEMSRMIGKNCSIKMISLLFWVILILNVDSSAFGLVFKKLFFSWFLSKQLSLWMSSQSRKLGD